LRPLAVVHRTFSSLNGGAVQRALIQSNSLSSQLLKISLPGVQQSAGLKHVGVPRLRCKHCYFVVKDELKYVMCTVHRRHLQAEKLIAAKYGNMIMTHATQGSTKSGGSRGSRGIKTQDTFRMDFWWSRDYHSFKKCISIFILIYSVKPLAARGLNQPELFLKEFVKFIVKKTRRKIILKKSIMLNTRWWIYS